MTGSNTIGYNDPTNIVIGTGTENCQAAFSQNSIKPLQNVVGHLNNRCANCEADWHFGFGQSGLCMDSKQLVKAMDNAFNIGDPDLPDAGKDCSLVTPFELQSDADAIGTIGGGDVIQIGGDNGHNQLLTDP